MCLVCVEQFLFFVYFCIGKEDKDKGTFYSINTVLSSLPTNWLTVRQTIYQWDVKKYCFLQNVLNCTSTTCNEHIICHKCSVLYTNNNITICHHLHAWTCSNAHGHIIKFQTLRKQNAFVIGNYSVYAYVHHRIPSHCCSQTCDVHTPLLHYRPSCIQHK